MAKDLTEPDDLPIKESVPVPDVPIGHHLTADSDLSQSQSGYSNPEDMEPTPKLLTKAKKTAAANERRRRSRSPQRDATPPANDATLDDSSLSSNHLPSTHLRDWQDNLGKDWPKSTFSSTQLVETELQRSPINTVDGKPLATTDDTNPLSPGGNYIKTRSKTNTPTKPPERYDQSKSSESGSMNDNDPPLKRQASSAKPPPIQKKMKKSSLIPKSRMKAPPNTNNPDSDALPPDNIEETDRLTEAANPVDEAPPPPAANHQEERPPPPANNCNLAWPL